MLYRHRCGRRLWMEYRDHGGSRPLFWDQDAPAKDCPQVTVCPGCDETLPDTTIKYHEAVISGELKGAPASVTAEIARESHA